jgi:serine/threonine protein kinase
MIASIRWRNKQTTLFLAGFQLDEYRIEHQLSMGGFSIVYLAADREKRSSSRSRSTCRTASPCAARDKRQAADFGRAHARLPLRHEVFFEEGRALAKLSHPNVIRVLNFFRANDTVYMVMEYEHGRTLQEFIQKNRAW